jgi:hypothetical protein
MTKLVVTSCNFVNTPKKKNGGNKKCIEAKGKVLPVCSMRALGGLEVWLLSFLTLALDGDEWSTVHPNCFTPGERAPDTH